MIAGTVGGYVIMVERIRWKPPGNTGKRIITGLFGGVTGFFLYSGIADLMISSGITNTAPSLGAFLPYALSALWFSLIIPTGINLITKRKRKANDSLSEYYIPESR